MRARGSFVFWKSLKIPCYICDICDRNDLFRCLLRSSWESDPVVQRTRSTNVKNTEWSHCWLHWRKVQLNCQWHQILKTRWNRLVILGDICEENDTFVFENLWNCPVTSVTSVTFVTSVTSVTKRDGSSQYFLKILSCCIRASRDKVGEPHAIFSENLRNFPNGPVSFRAKFTDAAWLPENLRECRVASHSMRVEISGIFQGVLKPTIWDANSPFACRVCGLDKQQSQHGRLCGISFAPWRPKTTSPATGTWQWKDEENKVRHGALFNCRFERWPARLMLHAL